MKLSKSIVSNILEKRQLQFEVDKLAQTIERQDEMSRFGVIHYGTKLHDKDGESGIYWWIFGGDLDNLQIRSSLSSLQIVEDTDRGVYDEFDWDCSGKCLTSYPSMKRTKTRVLITQSFCYDV
jgi:hypothetical protein